MKSRADALAELAKDFPWLIAQYPMNFDAQCNCRNCRLIALAATEHAQRKHLEAAVNKVLSEGCPEHPIFCRCRTFVEDILEEADALAKEQSKC